jgi:hypothetical protein
MNGVFLENVQSETLLGLTINHNLSWEEHIDRVVRKVNGKLALLRRIKGCLPLVSRNMFTSAHILPYMDYCSTVWGNSPHVEKVFLSQKRVARTVLDIKGKARTEPENRTHILLSKLKWMTIMDRISYRQVTMVYKCLIDLAPQYMTNMFTYVSSGQNTRQSTRKDLVVPPGKHKAIFEQTFRYSSVDLWNTLKPELRDSCSLSSFKTRYVKEHFNGA